MVSSSEGVLGKGGERGSRFKAVAIVWVGGGGGGRSGSGDGLGGRRICFGGLLGRLELRGRGFEGGEGGEELA